MHLREPKEAIAIAEMFIRRNGIKDEDLKQEIYLKAMETRSSRMCTVTKAFNHIIKRYNEDDCECLYGTFFTGTEDVITNKIVIERAMGTLTPREQYVISEYFGLYGGKCTLSELGNEFELTASRVQQIKDKALRKILTSFKRDWLNEECF